jgi:hypothetical protein
MNDFNNSWLGYDLPYEEVEAQPSVQAIRNMGVEKRVKQPEHHVTVKYFANVNLDELAQELASVAQGYEGDISQTEFLFDGFGQIKRPEGRYIYFSPNMESALEAHYLKSRLNPEGSELHLSIGGPDPFGGAKPMQHELKDAFRAKGRLVFVGNDGKQFRKFAWDKSAGNFVSLDQPAPSAEPKPAGPMPPQPIHTIAIFPKIQADTATAVYLLKNFGEKQFPGISQAKIIFWTAPPSDKSPAEYEKEGYLLLDLGGRFDHHVTNRESGSRSECLSTLVAAAIGMEKSPVIKKLLAWAKRDDLEGKGTISADPLDRAFGLSGIIMNLNREFANEPEKTLNIITTIIGVHVSEEYRRHIELPQEWETLKASGKAKEFEARQGSADLKCAFAHTDNAALAGYLRAAHKFDVVVIRRATGHLSMVTRQERSLDLRPVIASLRVQEALKKGLSVNPKDPNLMAPGKFPGLDEWYYDDAANTLQNGGINPQGIPASKLSDDEVLTAIQQGLPRGVIGALKRQKEQGLA